MLRRLGSEERHVSELQSVSTLYTWKSAERTRIRIAEYIRVQDLGVLIQFENVSRDTYKVRNLKKIQRTGRETGSTIVTEFVEWHFGNVDKKLFMGSSSRKDSLETQSVYFYSGHLLRKGPSSLSLLRDLYLENPPWGSGRTGRGQSTPFWRLKVSIVPRFRQLKLPMVSRPRSPYS